MEYERLEPFGAWRDNYHAATIAALLANIHRDKKVRAQPFDTSDFFYVDQETRQERREREQAAHDLLMIAKLDRLAGVN